MSVDYLRIWEVQTTDTVGGMLRWAADRAGFLDKLSSDDLDELDTVVGEVGFASDTDVTLDQIWWTALNTIGATAYEDRTGVIRIGRMEPATIGELSHEFTIDDVQGGIFPEDDTAQGLTSRFVYGLNYAAHTDSDIVEGATGPLEDLKRARQIVETAETLRAPYTEAADRPPLDTLFASEPPAQDECDRVNGFYATGPTTIAKLVRFEVLGRYTVKPRDVVKLTYPAYNFGGGRLLRVIYTRDNRQRGRCTIIGWWVPE
jgi:hypothetical protein